MQSSTDTRLQLLDRILSHVLTLTKDVHLLLNDRLRATVTSRVLLKKPIDKHVLQVALVTCRFTSFHLNGTKLVDGA